MHGQGVDGCYEQCSMILIPRFHWQVMAIPMLSHVDVDIDGANVVVQ
jgi:hypothetical protein